MLRCLLLTLTIILAVTGCHSSSKGKSGSSQGGDTQTPTTAYSLAGNASGIKGNLVLSNNDDSLTIASNGQFVFPKKLEKGALYDVKIVALPKNQLCELGSAKNYIYRDRNDLTAECADLVERKVHVQIPVNYSLADLQLLSNFQALGDQSETELTENDSSIALFSNTVLSLRNKKKQVLYLSYVGVTSNDFVEINSRTTAIALMLLEPTIASAIVDRGITISDIQESLTTAVNINGDLDKLTTAIQNTIDKGGNLTANNAAITVPLTKVLTNAQHAILSIPLTQAQQKSGNLPTKFNKLVVINPAESSGVDFEFSQASGTSTAITLSATNNFFRFVALQSEKFTKTLIEPSGNKSFNLPSGLGSQKNLDVTVIGPGLLGTLSSSNLSSLLEATSASGVNQYFLPSVSVLLGLNHPSTFKASDCFSSETITSLQNKSISLQSASDLLQQKNYYQLFSLMTYNLRDLFITAKNSNNQTPIEELFSCEKFGSGVLISSKKAIAIDNTSGILQALNGVFNPTTAFKELNLFSREGITQLSDAINKSFVEKIWTLSNLLKLDITASKMQVPEGETVNFTAACSNPSTKALLDCNVNWDFGNGATKSGLTTSNVYSKAGQYTVKATATTTDGAQQIQTVVIDVVPFAPSIKLVSALGTTLVPNQNIDFGDVGLGGSASTTLTLFNSGFSDLNLTNLVSSQSAFRVAAGYNTSVAPNATTNLTLIFEPTTELSYSGVIDIFSNAANYNDFPLKLAGKGVGSLGHWTITQGGSSQAFAAARISTAYDNATNNLQIRLFSFTNQEYPQIRILLKGYNVNSNTQGAGTYDLNDVGASQTCLGFYGADGSESNQFCTSTLSGNQVTGNVMVTNTSITTSKKAEFDFQAIPRNCINSAENCSSIRVKGELFYLDNL